MGGSGQTSGRGFDRQVGILLVVAMVFASGGCSRGDPTTAPRNVLLIVVDTLRADHVGVYGSEYTTPNMDALAARGVTFERAYSHIPITGPSHASMFTGLLPFEHGVHNNTQILDPNFQTLAEILADDGRKTAAVISLGVLQRGYGFGQGFGSYRDVFEQSWWKNAGEVNEEVFDLLDGRFAEPFFLWVHYSDPHEPYAPPDFEGSPIRLELNGTPVGELSDEGRGRAFDLRLRPGVNELRYLPAGSAERRIHQLTSIRVDDVSIEVRPSEEWKTRENRVGAPVFQSFLPASAELVNPESETRTVVLSTACKRALKRHEVRERYALEVKYVDRQIGRLLDRLGKHGLLDDTLVVFASDHGEGLGDHNHIGHISQLYDPLLRVPLIISQPDRLPEGLVVEQPVGLVDVLPTITDLLDLPTPVGVNGVSLLPLIAGVETDSWPVFGITFRPEAYSDKSAVIARGHKFIHSLTDDREWEEFYDLEDDPGELNDLAPSAPPMMNELRAMLRARLQSSRMADVNETELSEDEIDRLRELGYVH